MNGSGRALAAVLPLPEPTGMRMAPASNTDTTAVVVWEKPSDYSNVAGYDVYVDSAFVGSTNMTYFKVTGLLPSQSYDVTVRAYNAGGNLSGASNVVKVSTTATPVVVNVKNYGASGNGTAKDTAAIQAAIDACPANGEVYLPAGVYLSGALFLHSNMTFYVDAGAQLKPSTNLSDYPFVSARHDIEDIYGKNPAYASLLNAGTMDHSAGDTTTNIKIMGPGTIGDEANGLALRSNYDSFTGTGNSNAPLPAPVDSNGVAEYQAGQHIGGGSLISLKNCGGVYMDGLHIRNGMMWTVVPVYSDHITAVGLDVNTTVHNGDGFDPNSSTDVYILGTQFATGDDCSAIKSGKDTEGIAIGRPSDNLYYRGDVFSSGHGGVTIGSEMSGGVRDVFVEDCTLTPVDEQNSAVNPGIRVKVSPSRGGYIKNLQVRDCVCNEISVLTNYDKQAGPTGGVPLPDIENFRFTNVTAPNYAGASGNAIVLNGSNFGSSVSYLKNIQFQNCKFYAATLDTCQNVSFNNCAISQGIATSSCTNISQNGQVIQPSFPVDDSFDDSENVPSTWVDQPRGSGNGGGLFIVHDSADPSNHYLEIRDMGPGYETTDRSFAQQSSVVTSQFSFALPSLTGATPYFKYMDSAKHVGVYYQVQTNSQTNGIDLVMQNTNSSLNQPVISNLTAGQWYTVKTVIDVSHKTAAVYVNGTQVISGGAVYGGTSGTLNGIGTFEVRPPNNNSAPVYVDLDHFTVQSSTASATGGPISGIAVSAAAGTISAKGGTLGCSASVTSSDPNDQAYTWAVVNPDLSDTDAATIDAGGKLTAVKNGTVLVTATADDGSGTMGMAAVTITGQQSCVSFAPVDVSTTVGTAPQLPSTVYEIRDDGSTVPATVVWDTVASDAYARAGAFTVNGQVEETGLPVVADVTVSDVGIRSIEPAVVKAVPGSLRLPNLVTAVYNDGTTKRLPVTWDGVDASQYRSVNVKGFTVSGTVKGTTQKSTAQVSVLPVIVSGVTPILVAADGTGDFRTVHEAVQSIPADNAQRRVIYIKEGTYKEKLLVDRPYVTLAGESADGTILTDDDSPLKTDASGTPLGTYNDYTMQVTGHDFSAQNITIENRAGSGAGQAVALDVYADHASFEGCRILGYQDTLLTRNRTDTSVTDNVPDQTTLQTYRQYFKDCYIAGSVDYIFGASEAVFDGCELHSRLSGYETAASTPQNQPYGYVFLNCNLTAPETYSGAPSVYLGRSWRSYSAVAYLNCAMSGQIAKAGWATMHSSSDTATVRYSEYNSSGAGTNPSGRVSWSTQLTADQAANYTVGKLFNQTNGISCADSWDPTALAVPTAPPTMPVTVDDTAVTTQGAAYTGSVAGDTQNDDGSPLSFRTVDLPAHGLLTMHSDGGYTYTPNAGFSGVDSFTYQASNGGAVSNVSKIVVTVNLPAKPVASAASLSAEQSKAVNGQLSACAGDGGALTYCAVSQPLNGTVTVHSDGSFVYTSRMDFSGVDSFTYEALNQTVASDPATVTVTVNPVPMDLNRAPKQQITASAGDDGSGTAQITPDIVQAWTADDTIEIDSNGVSVRIPNLYLYQTMKGSTALTFRQSHAAADELAAAGRLLAQGGQILDSYALAFTRPDGTDAEPAGKVRVTVHLTDAELTAIRSAGSAKIFYYNEAGGKLEDTNATFDLTDRTATFDTTHFSTYILATLSDGYGGSTGADASSGSAVAAPVANPKTGDGSHPFALLLLLPLITAAWVGCRKRIGKQIGR